jgi:1-acyl-sn-glycerol-3-phosphate acyltransferase
VPIALNSGLFWPRRSLRRRPGTIHAEALPPIPPGLDRKVFFARLQSVLEEATAKLVQESEQESEQESGQKSGPGSG